MWRYKGFHYKYMGEKCIHLPVVGYIYFREREREREREFPQHVAVYGFSLYIGERCPFFWFHR